MNSKTVIYRDGGSGSSQVTLETRQNQTTGFSCKYHYSAAGGALTLSFRQALRVQMHRVQLTVSMHCFEILGHFKCQS